MRYKEYERASLKHLKACQAMLAGLSCQAKSISVAEKEYLLMDIFYLSGYTLECIINFALFKEVYKKPHNKPKYNDYTNVKIVEDSTLNFAFKFRTKANSKGYAYCIQTHNFYKNIQLLNNLVGKNTIPLISNPKTVPPNLLQMIRNWKAEARYHTHIKYNEKDIKSLVELTEKVYNAIIDPRMGIGL
ncbi:MAG: hypothetical protein LW814_17455 [Anabaena sp. CoA2_C59]|jgi:hypothetical protein|nr:hypothetical protein [Anabaena sp. CoA2_C59]MCX5982861.1 hypothetical protein [Nostocales cyanobacterium LacPavin_0920_SED1_MAG_38_18]MDJ0504548.1 hypothetical protein [Nostocales cyanobacterium LE14-WE12]